MKILLLVLSVFFVGCLSRVMPLKHEYVPSVYEKVIEKPKPRVWGSLLEFFKKSGLPVRLLDSSRGLIKLEQANLAWSYENKKGKLNNPGAWVVVERVIYKNKLLALSSIVGEWRIKINDTREGGTYLVVDLENLKYNTPGEPSYQPFLRATPRSTGVFERMMYDQIK